MTFSMPYLGLMVLTALVATPLVLWLDRREARKKQEKHP